MTVQFIDIPNPLRRSDTISCDIDGVLVRGIVSFTDKGIMVSLTCPVEGIYCRGQATPSTIHGPSWRGNTERQ